MADDHRGLRFGSIAQQYDAYRPSPPHEAGALLGDITGVEILEVAAGTGLWTRFLLEKGATVTAVEPDVDMLAVLQRRSPSVRTLSGSAEALPIDDESVDAVLVSSAWHWFIQPEATNEMARVLRDNGRLFVLWNGLSRDVPWVASLTELRESPTDLNRRARGWTAEFCADGPFALVSQVECHWNWSRTIEQVVALFGTYSGAIIRSAHDRRTMEGNLRSRLVDHVRDGVVEVAMTIRGTVARRTPRH
ncbi:MAG: class I SAM-dependent methyltransferase [Acidimicrobiales bacterium]